MGNEEFIMKSIDKEVSRGWAFPIPLNWAPLIPGIVVTPIGVAKQYTLNENSSIIPKNRMTHDCSRPSKSGLLLNLRIDDDKMEGVFTACACGGSFTKSISFALKTQVSQYSFRN